MPQYSDVGVVVRSYKLAESDRIIVLCTKNRGKVRAVANGIRKTKSKFGSRLEVGSHVIVQCYEGRNLDTITQAERVDPIGHVRSSLEGIERVAAIVEVVDQFSQEGERNVELYEMSTNALRALERWDSPLLVPSFYLKVLALEGVGIDASRCAECGEPAPLVALDISAGSVLCAQHSRGQKVSSQAVQILQLILGGHLTTALELPTGPASFEVDDLASKLMEFHLERRLRSLRILRDDT